MNIPIGTLRKLTAVLALMLAGGLLAACSSSSSTSATASSNAPTSAASNATTGTAGTSTNLAGNYAALMAGTNEKPPATGPKAAPGKNVWIISCGQDSAGCALFAGAEKSAAEALGWKATLFDGAFSPTTESQGIGEAIAAHASAIVLASIDCNTITAAIEDAEKAKIPVIDAPDFGCGVGPGASGPVLESTHVVPSAKYPTFAALAVAQGAGRADWIAKNDPHAKIIDIVDTGDAYGNALETGFENELNAVCPACQVVNKVSITDAEIAQTGVAGQKTSAALLANPTANTIIFPFDVVMELGGAQAVQQLEDRGRKLVVIGGADGSAVGMNYIRSGLTTAEISVPWSWAGWAAIDTLNRYFQHSPAVPAGIGIQAVTKTNALPSGDGPYDSSVGYIADYKAIWAS